MRKSRGARSSRKATTRWPSGSSEAVPHFGTFPVVAVGASAGGLEAITRLVENITPDFGMAYVIVEHLDPNHKSMLVELLSRQTTVPVEEVRHKTQIFPNHIYVIPPNRKMYLERGKLCLIARGSTPAKHMPIDYLFRSVALGCPGNCIGVVLSGTGSDGSLGIDEIKSAGGITFAQDTGTAKHDGMPRSAIAAGHIDYVLSPEAIALELKRISAHPYIAGKQIAELSRETQLLRIFSLLRSRTSVDFNHYKQNTVKRRIYRRMALLKIEKIEGYVKLVSENPKELDALYQDLLIKVTSFFREPSSFKVLRDIAFPAMEKNRAPRELIRVWVPGCSSGEEVYSLAIALLEYLGEGAGSSPIQIFGTDLSEAALEKARSGIYIENIALDVSADRLRRWFVRVDRGYQISKDIRSMCIFAKQNVTSDPPFSRIDLISCRNLLIYLDATLQTRVMPIFHYALKPTGFLMLGNSESVGASLHLFSPVDKSAKIYTRKISGHRPGVVFSPRPEARTEAQRIPMSESHHVPDIQQIADSFIVSRFAPVGVIVDSDLKIIHFRGSTGDYLEAAPGRASLSVLKMARGPLGLELRSLLQQAKAAGKPVRKEGISFKLKNQKARTVTIEVAPIRNDPSADPHFLVLFEEPDAGAGNKETASPASARERLDDQNMEAAELRRELAAANAQLQSTTEESEASNEELKSANEEIMSSNEELQSTNEELETAKEELQSANEELTTVNDEVQSRNSELSLLNNDLNNFLASVNVPVVMLGIDLKIRRFTPMSQQVFNLIPADIGRPFGDIKTKVHIPHLDQLIAHVIDTVTIHEQEVADDKGRYYRLSIRPYRTPEKKIDGAILVFHDIDSVKRANLLLEDARNYAESIIGAVFDPLLVLDDSFVVQRANSAYYRLFKTDARQTEDRPLFSLDKGQWDVPEIRSLLKATFNKRLTREPVEITKTFFGIGERSLLVNARCLARKNGMPPLLLVTMTDITARKQAEMEKERLASALAKERTLFESILRQLGVGVAIFEAPGGQLLLSNQGFRAIFKRLLPVSVSIASFREIHRNVGPIGDRRRHDWPMARSLENGEIVPYEEIVLPLGKSEKMTIQISSTPVYDAKKKRVAVVALFQDITESKRTINEQISDISGREQRRIAHDLHDGLGQELAAIAYRVEALKSHLSRARAAEAGEADKIGTLAEKALASLRDLIKVIQPVTIDARGLMHSLRDLAQSASRLYEIDCSFKCPRPVPVGNQDAALHLFRIAQEGVHNAVKHGKPRHIVIGLVRRGKTVELTITNDGANFKPTENNRNKGMGLHIMSYRAKVLKGEFTVARNQPKGTVVKCVCMADVLL